MQEPITIKELEDLKRRLLELRCSGKVSLLDDFETINDAIIVVEILWSSKNEQP